MKITYNRQFWINTDRLVRTSKIVIDRPRGSRHPRYPSFVYPINYGYLKNTKSRGDGHEIDIWVGTGSGHKVEAVMCTVDMHKRDSEITLLYSCTKKEIAQIYKIHNTSSMHGILIERGKKRK
jgi:inorganic pyrophosphatase